MPRRPKVPPETLIADYMSGKSLRTIAKERGVDVEHVRLTLKKHDIPRRPHGSNDTSRKKHGLTDTNFWTDERVEVLKQAIADGHSATVAGNIIGISRNACNGKAVRLGLKFGGYSAASLEQVRQARKAAGATRSKTIRAKPRPKPMPKIKLDGPTFRVKPYVPKPDNVVCDFPKSLLDRPEKGACKWVVQTDPPLYCANPTHRTYCAGHAAIAYVPDAPRDDRHIRYLAKNF